MTKFDFGTLISNFYLGNWFLFLFFWSLKLLITSEFIFETPWISYISEVALYQYLWSCFWSLKYVVHLKSLESLKSLLMFGVTFDLESYFHLWVLICCAVPFYLWIYLFFRSYFPSLRLLWMYEVAFYLWSCFLSLKYSCLWSHF